MNWKNSALMRRIGLGVFFLIFGLLKITNSKWFADGPYKGFYGMQFSLILLFAVGIVQLLLAVSFFMNKQTKTAAWIAVVMIAATTIATFPKIWTTFTLPPPAAPPGFLFVASIPLLFMALSEAFKK